jgi:hypothetical protein
MITGPVYQYAVPVQQPAPIMVPAQYHVQQQAPQQPLPDPAYSTWPAAPTEKSKMLAAILAFPLFPAPFGWLGCHKLYLQGVFSPCTCCDFFGAVCKDVDRINLDRRNIYYRQMRQDSYDQWRRLALVHSPSSVPSMR